ncbi:hypothetical protein [Methanobrevibacter sp.]|uniref:hypothetical protein n=1 Tax=Methanobrevibacter sp. TaxID=66852 RepID=UPI003866956A
MMHSLSDYCKFKKDGLERGVALTEKYKLNREYDTIMRDGEHWLIASIDTLDNAEKICKELNDKEEQIIKLKNENNMLKTTIGRNEAYINRLTHTSEWSNTAGG